LARHPEELRNELRTLLENSVRKLLLADVPVGVLLSGGVDSSLIVALIPPPARPPGTMLKLKRSFDPFVLESGLAFAAEALWLEGEATRNRQNALYGGIGRLRRLTFRTPKSTNSDTADSRTLERHSLRLFVERRNKPSFERPKVSGGGVAATIRTGRIRLLFSQCMLPSLSAASVR
jgi:Asparagine synthase